jgi:hypothetical protein
MQPVPPLKNREHAEEKAAFLHGKQGKHLFGEVLKSTNLFGQISGWWYTYPSEKYESVGIMKFPTECKIKIHVPNHQPDMISSVAVVAVNHHKKNVITYYHI